jgi:5-formyltetrahydrofolate cyclo-ligase
MTKAALRKLYKAKRLALTDKEKMKLDDLLLIQFQQLGVPAISCLMSYWPMPHQHEPNTQLFTSYYRHLIPNLHICYPVTNINDLSMQAMLIDEDTVYTTSNFGVTEPISDMVVPPAEIDLVFVPMLAYDNQGYRVGYGKGFYDRFLQQCHPSVITIGFSYFEPVNKIEDRNGFDVPLNYCITPDTIYEF